MTVTARLRPLVLALAFTLPLAGCWEKSPENRIENARQAIQKSDYKTAVIELKSALQKAPNNAEARLLLGSSLQSFGQWSDSEKELRKALEHGSPADQVLPLLAHALVKMGKFQETIDLKVPTSGMGSMALASLHAERANAYMGLNKAVEAAQSISDGQKTLEAVGGNAVANDLQLAKARLAFITNKPAEAMALLDTSLQRDSKFIEGLYMKAQLLQIENKEAEALKVYQQITATKPSEIPAHLAISDGLLRSNNLAGAEASIKAAESIDVGNLSVNYARAKLELAKGNAKKANEVLQQILRVAPDHIPSVLLNAAISFRMGNYEQSLKAASQIQSLYPNDLSSAMLVAANLMRRGDATSAIHALEPKLKAYPDNVKLLSLLGEAYLQAREYQKATEYLERALKLNPNDSSLKEGVARSHLAKGDTARATAELEELATLSEKASSVDMALIMIPLSQKQYDKALQAISNFEKKLPNNPVSLNLRAAALLGKNDQAGARKALEQALAIAPSFMPAVTNLAQLDLRDKKPAAARKRYEAVLEKDASNFQAMMALADIAATGKDEKNMVSWLEKAIKAKPDALKPRTTLVRYFLNKKDAQKALSLAREAASTNPESAEALALLGSVQMAAGEQDNALSTLTKVTQKSPDLPEAYYRLGMAQVVAKRPLEARRSFELALAKKSNHFASMDALLQLDLAEKKMEGALQRARQIQVQYPKSPVGFEQEADIHLLQRRSSQAAKAYEQAVGRGAGSASLTKLHRALYLAGNKSGADQKLTAWLKANPKDTASRAYAAEFNMLTGKNKEAIALYEEVLRLSPPNIFFLNNLAALYQREKDKRALAAAEQALKLAPQNPDIQDTLGWILVEQGKYDRGIDLLRTALATSPKAAATRYHYAVALARTGKNAEARKELEQLLASGQRFNEIEEAKSLLKGL